MPCLRRPAVLHGLKSLSPAEKSTTFVHSSSNPTAVTTYPGILPRMTRNARIFGFSQRNAWPLLRLTATFHVTGLGRNVLTRWSHTLVVCSYLCRQYGDT